MVDTATHRQGAQDNLDFVQYRLDPSDSYNRPWIVTAWFYAALHLVDAYFGLSNQHPGGHVTRNRLVANTPDLTPIWPHYLYLYDGSRDARYGLKPFSEAEVSAIRTAHLDPILSHMRGFLP
jgi:hypothetical protein